MKAKIGHEPNFYFKELNMIDITDFTDKNLSLMATPDDTHTLFVFFHCIFTNE